MLKNRIFLGLVVCIFLSSFCVNWVYAKRFLTLPFDGQFNQGATFCSYKFDNGNCHGGTDWPLPNGTPVFASADGFATAFPDPKRSPSYGNRIDIEHNDGYITRYAHLSSFVQGITPVDSAIQVYRGQLIGYSGTTGGPWLQDDGQRRDAYHLHFEVRHNGTPVDPYNSNDYLWLTTPPSRSSAVQFSDSSAVYFFSGGSNGKFWPILNEKVYSLLGYGTSACSLTPDWSHIISAPDLEKSKYTIRNEVIPSENNAATGRMIAYRIVPKVGPISCMSVDVDSRRIYLFQNGKFWHIANYEVYKSLGYKDDFSDVVIITPDWRRRRFI